MRAEGAENTAMAAGLGLSEGDVRRLVDLDYRAIGQVEAALHALGQHAGGVDLDRVALGACRRE